MTVAKQLTEIAGINKCKLHSIHFPQGDVVKIDICEEIEFYSDRIVKLAESSNDVETLCVFFDEVILAYRNRLEEIIKVADEYNSESTEYSNDLIHSLFSLLKSVKQSKKYAIELCAELGKIAKEFNSTELDERVVDALEVKDEFELLADMVSDTVEMISHLNENDTNNLMKKLTTLTVVFTPLNLLAGMGGMSEWSGFVADAGLGGFWGYVLFAVALVVIGLLTARYLKK